MKSDVWPTPFFCRSEKGVSFFEFAVDGERLGFMLFLVFFLIYDRILGLISLKPVCL